MGGGPAITRGAPGKWIRRTAAGRLCAIVSALIDQSEQKHADARDDSLVFRVERADLLIDLVVCDAICQLTGVAALLVHVHAAL